MSYDDRKSVQKASEAFEKLLIKHLNTLPGWRAFPYGRAALDPDCNTLLSLHTDDVMGEPPVFRWQPDIIAFYRMKDSNRCLLVMIDAKVPAEGNLGTSNHGVEAAALENYALIERSTHVPVLMVFNSSTTGQDTAPYRLADREISIKDWLNAEPAKPYSSVDISGDPRCWSIVQPSVAITGEKRPGTGGERGSKNPWYLVNKEHAKPFEYLKSVLYDSYTSLKPQIVQLELATEVNTARPFKVELGTGTDGPANP